MKIDTHSHTKGVSLCSTVTPEQYVKAYVSEDYGGVILTNHYSRHCMFALSNDPDEQVKKYIEEYRKTAEIGKAAGLNVMLGAEVAISTPQSPYVEFLIYGVNEEFFFAHPCLYDKTQKELYKLCHDNNALLFQSHPFRSEHGHFPQDPEYLDGTEINCHPSFLRHEEETYAFADKYNLMLLCCNDLHYEYQAGIAGTIVPDTVYTTSDLVDYLRINPRPQIYIR